MEKKVHLYYQGYLDGYRAGIRDAGSGNSTEINKNDLKSLPIRAMALSTRAHNCLSRAGCVHIGDVAALNGQAIETMRNMGAKTAAEVAAWLDFHGICPGAWSKYL